MSNQDANDEALDKDDLPGIKYLWCTFIDAKKTYILKISSNPESQKSGAIRLPENDPRVVNFYDRNPPERAHVQRIVMSTLDDLHRLAYQFDFSMPKPLYRGQSDYSWSLQTKLERDRPDFVINETGLEVYEYRVFIEAQRRLQHFIEKLPDEDDRLSWLALLRHHAVPTRLLDASRSLFVACYFALRDARPGIDAAVWIFSRQSIESSFHRWSSGADDSWLRSNPFTISQYGDTYYWPHPKKNGTSIPVPTIESLRNVNFSQWLDYSATLDAALRGYVQKPGVAIAEPSWLSRRMDAQQGVFLIPFNVRLSFEANLSSHLDISMEETDERPVPVESDDLFRLWSLAPLIKIRIPAALHPMLRVRLESMNIRELTLFPDAEGALAHVTSLVPLVGR